jgi:hypothetical protein
MFRFDDRQTKIFHFDDRQTIIGNIGLPVIKPKYSALTTGKPEYSN